jgi:integrase/recombinase XerD
MTVPENSGNTRRRQQRIRSDGNPTTKGSHSGAAQTRADEKVTLVQAKARIPIAPHITAFFEQRLPIERRASENTRDSYAYAFQLLLTFASKRVKVAPSQLAVEQIDAPLVLDFLNDLETTRGNGPSSRNIRLAAIKSFMHFLEYRVPSAIEQIRRIFAIPAKKADSRLVRHLTAEEIQALLDAPDPTGRQGIRDRAMLHLCYAGGLRVSELVNLRLDDLKFEPQANVLVHGKGRRQRCLPLWKTTTAALRAWLAVRGTMPVPELFVSARGESLTRSGFEYILRKHIRTAKQHCKSLATKRVSPHVLRHYLPFRIMSRRRSVAFIFRRRARCSGDIEIGFLSSVAGERGVAQLLSSTRKPFSPEVPKGALRRSCDANVTGTADQYEPPGALLSSVSSLRPGQDYVGRIAEGFA